MKTPRKSHHFTPHSNHQSSLLINQSFLYDTLAVVLVGPEKHRFDLHRGLLCKTSDFFKAAFEGKFMEAEGTLALPEQDPGLFKYFIHWLYTGSLRGYLYPPTKKPTLKELKDAVKGKLLSDNEDTKVFNLANYRDAHFHTLVQLYILADALQVKGLQDRIITLLIEVYGYASIEDEPSGCTLLFWSKVFNRPNDIPSPATSINLAFRMLPQGDHLRNVLLLLFADNANNNFEKYYAKSFEKCFLVSYCNTMLWRWAEVLSTTEWEKDGMVCNFHKHDVECSLDAKHWDECDLLYKHGLEEP
jgi:hypothetical protein